MARLKTRLRGRLVLLGRVLDEWRRVVLGTTPADRVAAERSVAALYQWAGLPRPLVIWFDSPLGAAIALVLLGTGFTDGSDRRQARQCLGEASADRLSWLVREQTGHTGQTGQTGRGRLGRPLRECVVHLKCAGLEALSGTREVVRDHWGWWTREHELYSATLEHLGITADDELPEALASRARGWLHGAMGRPRLFSGPVGDFIMVLDRMARDELRMARDGPALAADSPLGFARNAYCWWLFEHVAVLSDRPVVLDLDEADRLHAVDGPALAWRDGRRAWVWHGVRVPHVVIQAPETLTVAAIHAERDLEVRRIMLERYGYERYLHEAEVTEVHRDGYGVLYSAAVPDDEPVVMVEVTNATPEPDGTWKRYLLRVPPGVRTAREAVAWTFDMDPRTYAPRAET